MGDSLEPRSEFLITWLHARRASSVSLWRESLSRSTGGRLYALCTSASEGARYLSMLRVSDVADLFAHTPPRLVI